MRIAVWVLAGLGVGCGAFVTPKEHEALRAEQATVAGSVDRQREEITRLRAEMDATRQRLENALRANAESGADLIASKQRVNELVGKLDETNHEVDELKKELAGSRTEIYGRLDDLKRAQPTPPPGALAPAQPAVQIPPDRPAHFAAIELAHQKRDWAAVRALGLEYVNRYPSDDKADDALYLVANADLEDGRPSSTLGHLNRLLKLFPKTNVLDKVLFDMGEAYLAMKDCKNAKLAYQACDARFSKDRLGAESKRKILLLEAPKPGMCAP